MTETRTEKSTEPRKRAAKKTAEASPATESPVAPSSPDVPMITADQMRLMHVLLRHQMLLARDDVLEFIGSQLGRPVESRNDLTRDEAGTLIDLLQNMPAPEPEPQPTVLEAITSVRKDMPAVGRNQQNEDQQYRFRGIDDVMAALGPTMVRHGVGYYPTVEECTTSERPTRSGGSQILAVLRIAWTIYGPGGDWIKATTYGEGLDSSDKSINKAATAAEKYMLTQVFAIPTRDYDADQWSPQLEGPMPAGQDRPAPPSTAELLKRLDEYAASQGIDRETMTAKWRRDNGDIPVEALDNLRPEVVFPLVRQIGEYLNSRTTSDAGGYS